MEKKYTIGPDIGGSPIRAVQMDLDTEKIVSDSFSSVVKLTIKRQPGKFLDVGKLLFTVHFQLLMLSN